MINPEKIALKIILLVASSLIVIGCVNIIELDTAGNEEKVVIFGKLTNSRNYDQGITIKRSNLNTRVGLSFTDAEVIVFDDDTGESFTYEYSTESDRYVPLVRYAGTPGHAYRARVTVNGQVYESSPQVMPMTNAEDSAYFRFERDEIITNAGTTEQWRLKILIKTNLPDSEEALFLRWNVDQVYILEETPLPTSSFPFYSPRACYVFDGAASDELVLFNGSLVKTTVIPEQEVADVPFDNSFVNVRGYGVIQSSITREAAAYWERVLDVADRSGSIFEVPPAPVPGNFQNLNDPNNAPLGFFEVAKMDTIGTSVIEDDHPIGLGMGMEYPNCDFLPSQFVTVPINCFECLRFFRVPDYCWNCTEFPNSTRKRPNFFF